MDRLFALHRSASPSDLLLRLVRESEPLFGSARLPTIHPDSVFSRHFAQRVAEVWDKVRRCQEELHFPRRQEGGEKL